MVAACGIIGKQVLSVWDYIFTSHCDNCRGTGRMICRNCRGTKTLRSRPGEIHFVKHDLADQNAKDLYRCVYCGPDSKHDATMVPDTQQQIDMLEYLNCQANIKAAVAGKPRGRKKSPILAGLTPCAQCNGRGIIRRHTPNFARLGKLEVPLIMRVAQRSGVLHSDCPPSRTREITFAEFPSRPRYVEALDPPAWMRKARQYRRESAAARRAGKRVEDPLPPPPMNDDLPPGFFYPCIDDGDTTDGSSDDEFA